MRLRPALAGLALALAAPAVVAQPRPYGVIASPVRTPPLAPGELLFETGGIGRVTAPADLVTLRISVTTRAASLDSARRANRVQVQRLIEAARRAGAPADGFIAYGGSADLALHTSMSANFPLAPDDAVAASASSMIIIRLRDIARFDAVQAAIAASGGETAYSPVYALSDAGPARRAAQARALARARGEAEAYAAARNMRVARIVRITERLGFSARNLVRSREAELQPPGNIFGAENDPDIEVRAVIGVDFALAPR